MTEACAVLPISVLMATYAADAPEHLQASLESLFGQTVKFSQLVLVVDGPIGPELAAVIDGFRPRHESADQFDVVQVATRGGLGAAANVGLSHCKNSLIARMDADDISMANRLERQWCVWQSEDDLSVLGTWHAEFAEDKPDHVLFVKKAPTRHADIARVMRSRCCVSHPTVLMSKAAIVDAGGYPETRTHEDYLLFRRMLRRGHRFAIIDDPLVKVRVSEKQRARRGGTNLLRGDWQVYVEGWRHGEHTLLGVMVIMAVWAVFRLSPPFVKAGLYRFVRSRPTDTSML